MTSCRAKFQLLNREIGHCHAREGGSESILQRGLEPFEGPRFERGQANCRDAAFVLVLSLVLSLQTNPSAFAMLIPSQVPIPLGNGLYC